MPKLSLINNPLLLIKQNGVELSKNHSSSFIEVFVRRYRNYLLLFFIFLLLFGVHYFVLTQDKSTQVSKNNSDTNQDTLILTNNDTISEAIQDSTSILNEEHVAEESNQEFKDSLLQPVGSNFTAVTIVYYTNFGKDEQIMTLSIPDEMYGYYHRRIHPQWVVNLSERAVAEYLTVNNTILREIVCTIQNQTKTQEELADALLNFVQDKGHILSLRCYPSNQVEFKYPIETLVEMGGDCDAKTFLYSTLLKIAGFKTLLVRSEIVDNVCHVAVGVQLDKEPEKSNNNENYFFIHNEERYYFAETTNDGWMVGDIPSKINDSKFSYIPL